MPFNEQQMEFLKSLGQLETGRDNSKTIGQYNYFNVKDFSGKGPRAFDRLEKSNDAYMSFESPDAAYQHQYDLLSRRYPTSLQATNIQDFANALKAGGYATDPNYVSKLVNVHNSRLAREQQVQAQSPAIDFSQYQAAYGDAIRSAKAQGFTDQQILSNIQQDEQLKVQNQQKLEEDRRNTINTNIEAQKSDAVRQVAARLAKNGDPIDGVAYLATLPGYAEEIRWARQNGYDNKSILRNLVGEAYTTGMNAFQKRQGTSFLGNTVDGIADVMKNYAHGTRQLLTFDPERERQLIAEEDARRLDPERVALHQTWGYELGNAVPELVAGAATGGSSLATTALGRIAIGAGISALSSGAKAVGTGESRSDNVFIGGIAGAAGTGLAEGVMKLGGVAQKVKNMFSERAVPIHDDILARSVSENMAGKMGVPLKSQYVDSEWFKEVGTKLSNEYDSMLDNHEWVAPDNLKSLLSNPEFLRHINTDDVKSLDSLIFEKKMRNVPVREAVLDSKGNPVFKVSREVVRDADGFPVKETFDVTKTKMVPVKETYHVPEFGYQMSNPKMVRAQVIGPDGNVQMLTRLRPAFNDETGQPIISSIKVKSNGESVPIQAKEPYKIPKVEYQQVQGKMIREQVKGTDGKIRMIPKVRNVVDENGHVVMRAQTEVLQKVRNATDQRLTPKYKYVNGLKEFQVERSKPVELRTAFSVLKQLRDQVRSVDSQADPLQRENLAKVLDVYERAFIDGIKLKSGTKETIVGETPEALKAKFEDLGRRYGEYSLAKAVYARGNTSGADFGDVNLWNSISKNGDYRDRFVKGESPNVDIVKGLQENAQSVAAADARASLTSTAGDAIMSTGYMTANPLVTATGGMLKFIGKAKQKLESKPLEGIEKIISNETIRDAIVKHAHEQAARNMDRRVANVAVETERRVAKPKRLTKTLQKLQERRMAERSSVVAGGSQSDEK